MLGEKLGGETGKVTMRRVVANPGGMPKMEVSFEAKGTILGVAVQDMATYQSIMRPDGTVYGEGQGVIMGHGGEMASWVGQGVGVFGKDGAISYRGAVYYSTATPAWARLNKCASIFEYEVDAQGNTKSEIHEWK
jgi:hypothetical protein